MSETLYTTVFLIDRYLSLQPIKKSQLHILGVTALLIATKYEEIYPPELKDLRIISGKHHSLGDVDAGLHQVTGTLINVLKEILSCGF